MLPVIFGSRTKIYEKKDLQHYNIILFMTARIVGAENGEQVLKGYGVPSEVMKVFGK